MGGAGWRRTTQRARWRGVTNLCARMRVCRCRRRFFIFTQLPTCSLHKYAYAYSTSLQPHSHSHGRRYSTQHTPRGGLQHYNQYIKGLQHYSVLPRTKAATKDAPDRATATSATGNAAAAAPESSPPPPFLNDTIVLRTLPNTLGRGARAALKPPWRPSATHFLRVRAARKHAPYRLDARSAIRHRIYICTHKHIYFYMYVSM